MLSKRVKGCAELEARTVEFWDGDYGFQGTRACVGTFEVVAIDINHPNYGYFAEFMAFWRSPHLPNWQRISVHRGSRTIKKPKDLVKRFPQFVSLFEEEGDE